VITAQAQITEATVRIIAEAAPILLHEGSGIGMKASPTVTQSVVAKVSTADEAVVRGVAAASGKTDGIPSKLYHYTNETGMNGIVDSNVLNPSLKALNPNDVRYGNGQYLSDIVPGTKTPAQLSKAFINNPFQGARYKNFVEIDTAGLNVIQGRPGVFVVPNETPLNLTNRITNSGKVPGQ
jgi:large repetitive protein